MDVAGKTLEYNALDERLSRFALFCIRHRRAGLILQLLVIAACIGSLLDMRLYDDPNQWPPKNDPFVELNKTIADSFGGTNSVSIELSVKSGSIYTVENLATVKAITDALYLVPGIIPYAVRSIATLDARRVELQGVGTADETIVDTPLMPQYPHTEAQAESIADAVRANPLVNGVLASKDGKAALILADFRSQQPKGRVKVATTEPVAIYHAVTRIINSERRPGITLRAAGTPIIIGWVNSDGLRYVFLAFLFFIVAIALTLWYGFRTISGVVLPLRVALLGVLMGFGLYRLFFGPVLHSAAVLLAPFIIVAAGGCHSVQFLTRFFHEEYPRLKNVQQAIVSTFVSRLRPMLVSLLCDVVPFAVMALIPFENVRALGIVTSLGLISLTVDEFLMMIPALSSVTLRELESSSASAAERSARGAAADEWLARMVRSMTEDRIMGIAIVAGCVGIAAVLGWRTSYATVGQNNTYAIHNYLTRSWNRSDIFHMEREITARFGGVYPMTILVASNVGNPKSLEVPAVMRAIDQLAIFFRTEQHIGNVADLAFSVKLYNQLQNDEKKTFFRVPDTRAAVGGALYAMVATAPGAYDWLFTEDYDSCVIIGFSDSTDPKVVAHLITATRAKVAALFAGLPVTVSVAGGSVGIAQAFNRNVKYWLIVGACLGFVGTFLVSLPFIGSVRLSAILIVPLILGTISAVGLMVMVGIELNSNAVAALAIASGVGIDSEVYLLYRVREEYAAIGNFHEALVRGYVKIRRALIVSNGALIVGCWILTPIPLYVGYVGFGMGLVLLFCFVISAVMSPILWSWFGGRVVVGRRSVEVDGRAEVSEETESGGRAKQGASIGGITG